MVCVYICLTGWVFDDLITVDVDFIDFSQCGFVVNVVNPASVHRFNSIWPISICNRISPKYEILLGFARLLLSQIHFIFDYIKLVDWNLFIMSIRYWREIYPLNMNVFISVNPLDWANWIQCLVLNLAENDGIR